MMAMPRVIFSILIAITILLMRSADADATLPKVRIQLPWYLSVEWAGIIMAKEKGFDKRFGVDLDILEYASGIDPVQSVTSNKADMGLIDAFSIIMHRARGDKIQAIWAQMQVSPLGICTLKEINITQISDLRGRTFGTDRAYEYLLDIMLARAGVSKDEINIVYLDGDPVIPLEQGMVDAVGCFDTYQAPILRIRGFNPFIIRSSDFGLNFYEQVIFVNKNHIAHSITIKKAIMAINQGWMYALNNIDETVGLIVNKYR